MDDDNKKLNSNSKASLVSKSKTKPILKLLHACKMKLKELEVRHKQFFYSILRQVSRACRQRQMALTRVC